MPKRAPRTEGGRRVPVMTRTTVELRQALEEAAAASGRSLGQEVESRLEMSAMVSPMVSAMISDKASLQLFQTMANVLRAVRKIAKQRGWSEIETRQALKHAFDVISSINFWSGGDVAGPPDGYAAHSKEKHTTTPAQDGYDVAMDTMIYNSAWDECVLMEGFGNVITDYWSGSGNVTINAPETIDPPAPARSLAEIVGEVSAGDQANEAMRRANKKMRQEETEVTKRRQAKSPPKK